MIASRYHAEYVDGLAEAALTELGALAPGSQIDVLRVPGSFEIPLAVQRAASSGKVDAVFAFGLIWEGQTLHADLIATAITNALMEISLRLNLPVFHEVLVVKDQEQARARCLSHPESNRGTEAARAAIRMLTMLDELAEDPDFQ